MNHIFSEYTHHDLHRLISDYPLAWVISPTSGIESASLLPLIGEYDNNGKLLALIGHMARSNPLHTAFCKEPTAHILFSGPQGYISPEHAGKRNWGPTWNYVAARIEASIDLNEDMTDSALDVLITECEKDRRQPWSKAELGERYQSMHAAIIGFTAKVEKIEATFKLGQDENETVLSSIIASHSDPVLSDWMHSVNKNRLE